MKNTISTTTTTKEPDSNVIIVLPVTLGKVLLENARQTDWMDMDTLADLCKKHGVTVDGEYPDRDELESLLRPFFMAKGELFEDGITVDGWDRRVGWEDVFCVRFFRYNPPQHVLTNEPVEELASACND